MSHLLCAKLTLAVMMLTIVSLSYASQRDVNTLDIADACSDKFMALYSDVRRQSSFETTKFYITNGQQVLGKGLYRLKNFFTIQVLESEQDSKARAEATTVDSLAAQLRVYVAATLRMRTVTFESRDGQDIRELRIRTQDAEKDEPAVGENRVRARGIAGNRFDDVVWTVVNRSSIGAIKAADISDDWDGIKKDMVRLMKIAKRSSEETQVLDGLKKRYSHMLYESAFKECFGKDYLR